MGVHCKWQVEDHGAVIQNGLDVLTNIREAQTAEENSQEAVLNQRLSDSGEGINLSTGMIGTL